MSISNMTKKGLIGLATVAGGIAATAVDANAQTTPTTPVKQKQTAAQQKADEIKAKIKSGEYRVETTKGETTKDAAGNITMQGYTEVIYDKNGKVVGGGSYSKTYNKQVVKGTKVIPGKETLIKGTPGRPVVTLTPEQRKAADARYIALTPEKRIAQDKAWIIHLAKLKAKKDHVVKTPDVVIPTETTTITESEIDRRYVAVEDTTAAPVPVLQMAPPPIQLPPEEVKEPLPIIAYAGVGIRNKLVQDDVLSATNSKLLQVGVYMPKIAQKGIGSIIGVDANVRVLKNAPYTQMSKSTDCGSCNISYTRNATTADATQYEASMGVRIAKEFTLIKGINLKAEPYIMGGPMYRWGPSINKMNDIGSEIGTKRITPNQRQRDQFVGYGELGLKLSKPISNVFSLYAQANLFTTTAKPVNATPAYTDEAMAANPYLTNKYPYSKNGNNIVEDARATKNTFGATDFEAKIGISANLNNLFKPKRR